MSTVLCYLTLVICRGRSSFRSHDAARADVRNLLGRLPEETAMPAFAGFTLDLTEMRAALRLGDPRKLQCARRYRSLNQRRRAISLYR